MENNLKFPETLKSRSDFQKLFLKGKRFFPSSWLIINYHINESGKLRLGWTVPRFVGNAVLRNKYKRWCRELSRKHFIDLNHSSYDINFVFKKAPKDFYKNLEFKSFEMVFKKVVRKIKVVEQTVDRSQSL